MYAIAAFIWLAQEFTSLKKLRWSVAVAACLLIAFNEMQTVMFQGKGNHLIASSLVHLADRLERGEVADVRKALEAVAARMYAVPHPALAFGEENARIFSDTE